MPVAPTTEAPAGPLPPARPLWRTILTPRWSGLLVLAAAIAAVMSVLGVWQLDVYQSKTAAATAQRAQGEPVRLQALFSIDDGLPAKAVGRRVTASGTWGPAADQLFISDRRQGDRDGFWVVTPLILDSAAGGATGAVMVVRGWVPTVEGPASTPPAGRVDLSGVVAASEAQDASADAAKGRVLQSLRIPTIVHLVDYRLYDAFVVLSSSDRPVTAEPGAPVSAPVDAAVDAGAAPAIVVPPSPPTDHAGLRNVAYAFQWWLFAAFTLWMWGRMVLDAHREVSVDRPADPLEPDGTVSA